MVRLVQEVHGLRARDALDPSDLLDPLDLVDLLCR